ncbi:MAG: hypothetical protein Unbinned5179contig1000_12 [Prokaryotic dsDNA virus sp.]|nr:MAG: hypothetical protein Unbinned5179contig1000_12 [Prokaryotic dsDNA virus sp.]
MMRQINDATDYISVNVTHYKDISDIAWKFLLGDKIIRCLKKMEERPEKGTELKIISKDIDCLKLKMGNVTIDMKASKPNSGIEIPPNQPNSM